MDFSHDLVQLQISYFKRVTRGYKIHVIWPPFIHMYVVTDKKTTK